MPVAVTELCGLNANGRVASPSITPNATQLNAVRAGTAPALVVGPRWRGAPLAPCVDSSAFGAPHAQANNAGAAVLVPGSACPFQTIEDYYQGACRRVAQLTTLAHPPASSRPCTRCWLRRAESPCPCALRSLRRPDDGAAQQRTRCHWCCHGRRLCREDPRADDDVPNRLRCVALACARGRGVAKSRRAGALGFRLTVKPTCILYLNVRGTTAISAASMPLTCGARSNTRRCGMWWVPPAATLVRQLCRLAASRTSERVGRRLFKCADVPHGG